MLNVATLSSELCAATYFAECQNAQCHLAQCCGADCCLFYTTERQKLFYFKFGQIKVGQFSTPPSFVVIVHPIKCPNETAGAFKRRKVRQRSIFGN
jgi:hypothetical protein